MRFQLCRLFQFLLRSVVFSAVFFQSCQIFMLFGPGRTLATYLHRREFHPSSLFAAKRKIRNEQNPRPRYVRFRAFQLQCTVNSWHNEPKYRIWRSWRRPSISTAGSEYFSRDLPPPNMPTLLTQARVSRGIPRFKRRGISNISGRYMSG